MVKKLRKIGENEITQVEVMLTFNMLTLLLKLMEKKRKILFVAKVLLGINL